MKHTSPLVYDGCDQNQINFAIADPGQVKGADGKPDPTRPLLCSNARLSFDRSLLSPDFDPIRQNVVASVSVEIHVETRPTCKECNEVLDAKGRCPNVDTCSIGMSGKAIEKGKQK